MDIFCLHMEKILQDDVLKEMDAREQSAFLQAHLVQRGHSKAEIAEWGSLVMQNDKMHGCQRIRCFPPGVFNANTKRTRSLRPGEAAASGYHSNHVHDCIFAIPGPDSEVSFDDFDFKDCDFSKDVIFGRVYCIFTVEIKFRKKRRRCDPRGSELDYIASEDCVLIKEFVKCAPGYTQPGQVSGNTATAQALSRVGSVKLREMPHGASIWKVLPMRHVLGQVPLAPLTHQKSKKPAWNHRDDVMEERMWRVLSWTMNWSRDKKYQILPGAAESASRK